jgi:hypothetical protein
MKGKAMRSPGEEPLLVTIALEPEVTLRGGKPPVRARPIDVRPAQRPATKGNQIVFKLLSEDAKTFTLIFPDGSPFAFDEIHARGRTSARCTVTAEEKRSFHYYVAIATGDSVFLIASCPEIIIR